MDYLNPIEGKWKIRWSEGRDNLFRSMLQARHLADWIRRLLSLGFHVQSGWRQTLLISRLLAGQAGNSNG